MTRTVLAMLLLSVLPTAISAAAGPQSPSGDSNVRLEHNPQKFVTCVTIRSQNGEVAWSDVLGGLARACGYDDRALEGVLPDSTFDLNGIAWRIALTGLNMGLSPDIVFSVQPPTAPGGSPSLAVTLDEAALLQSQRKLTQRLRDAFVPGGGRKSDRWGLALDDDWEKAAPEKDLVIAIHGVNSGPHAMGTLLAGPRKAGFPCGTFTYPNDQAIADSAKLLAGVLKEFAREHPNRSVSIITHSMGGLIARAAIEDPQLDPGNVRRLIMIAPPNHGSLLAHFAYGLDLSEHVLDKDRKKKSGFFYAMIEDGLSEAYGDLKPESQFLAKLNACKRNPNVRYTIFLGTSTPVNQEDLERFHKSITNPDNRWLRFFGSKIEPWVADMDEIVDGRGDGAVAVKRGRLETVPDTHLLKFNHITVLHDPGGDTDLQKLHKMILERLEKDTP